MLSFRLSDDFVSGYDGVKVPWGNTDAGGNSVGEITFLRTYSRKKDDGTKETWQEVCRRVIEGMYSIQKDWCKSNKLPWNDRKAHASAQEAFDRMFNLKWTPPGRGLHQMGAPQVIAGNSASLQNCANVSTGDIDMRQPGYVFQWGMEALMNGVGLGFDTLGASRNIMVSQPTSDITTYEIPDTREGWAESVGYLVQSYLRSEHPTVEFDYSLIRPAGAPIRTFGGTASGPGPLRKVHEQIRHVLDNNAGSPLSSATIVDIFNLIGTCVVAGNVRRSAELALGSYDDDDFLNLKNPEAFPERNSYDSANPGWAWSSNNSINVPVGADYGRFIDRIVNNGEPGFIWLDHARSQGRGKDLPDNRDRRVTGFNPCSEQPLESFEMCTLVSVHLQNHTDSHDLLRTLKFAFLYAKTVTLLPTPWPKTNAVMQRNRRIGLSMTGMTDVMDSDGMPVLIEYMEAGYDEIRRLDKVYSEWLCVRESNRVTTVKPEGTISILSGAAPGVHWTPGGSHFLRAIRFSNDDQMLPLFVEAGYKVEPDVVSANTTVVYFPIKSKAHRSEKDVTIFEKIGLAAKAQHHWSDNGVSVTISFDKKSEASLIEPALRLHEGTLKAVSFLPMDSTYYPQMPYTEISEEEYNSYIGKLGSVDMNRIYGSLDLEDVEIERGCTTDVCTI